MEYTYDYPRAMLTSDIVLLHSGENGLKVLLIKRANNPYAGMWALPGGFMEMDETTQHAAERELHEETGLLVEPLQQYKVYDQIDRDPRGRTVTVVHLAIITDEIPSVKAGDDASEAEWYSLGNLPPLAFDHENILRDVISDLGDGNFGEA